MIDFYSLKVAEKDRIGYASQKFGRKEISPPLSKNPTTPLAKNMISENQVQYACDAHQMKGIEERNTDMESKWTHIPPDGRNRPFSNMAAVK